MVTFGTRKTFAEGDLGSFRARKRSSCGRLLARISRQKADLAQEDDTFGSHEKTHQFATPVRDIAAISRAFRSAPATRTVAAPLPGRTSRRPASSLSAGPTKSEHVFNPAASRLSEPQLTTSPCSLRLNSCSLFRAAGMGTVSAGPSGSRGAGGVARGRRGLVGCDGGREGPGAVGPARAAFAGSVVPGGLRDGGRKLERGLQRGRIVRVTASTPARRRRTHARTPAPHAPEGGTAHAKRCS